MNWLALFSLGIFMVSVMGVLGQSIDSGWVQVALILLTSCGVYFALIRKHTVYQDDNFKLSILNHFPLSGIATPSKAEPAAFKLLPVEPHRLYVEVQTTRGFPVKSINFCCIRADDIGGSPVKSPVQITYLNDPNHEGMFRPNDDGYYGADGEYSDVRSWGKNRSLYFEVLLNPKSKWCGLLSFKARDPDGFCSYGRYAIAFGMTYEEAINSRSALPLS